MTTPRHRRTPDQVTRDRLEAKLRKQNDEVTYWKNGLEWAEAEAAKTRQALTMLGVSPLPGLEPEPTQGTPQAAPEGPSEPAAVSVMFDTTIPSILYLNPVATWVNELGKQVRQEITSEINPASPLLTSPTTCPWKPDGPPHPHRETSPGVRECVEVTP